MIWQCQNNFQRLGLNEWPTMNFDDWKNLNCIIEVDLYYPEDLHNLHNVLHNHPLAPERVKIEIVKETNSKYEQQD